MTPLEPKPTRTCPTPAEIESLTAEIRMGWSEYELLKRGRTDLSTGVDGPAIRVVKTSGMKLPREWIL